MSMWRSSFLLVKSGWTSVSMMKTKCPALCPIISSATSSNTIVSLSRMPFCTSAVKITSSCWVGPLGHAEQFFFQHLPRAMQLSSRIFKRSRKRCSRVASGRGL